MSGIGPGKPMGAAAAVAGLVMIAQALHDRRCACVGYTIRTDYGTGVEHDVDRENCPIHRDQEPE